MNIRMLTQLRGAWRSLGWELVLVILLAAIVVMNTLLSPYFLDFANLMDSTFNFDEKAMIALPMALLIISREIDVSVASIMVLAAVMMGLASGAGADTTVIVLVGLGTGLVAGLINGLLVTGLGVHSIVVTIGTLSLYRGISEAIVQDGAFSTFPQPLFFFGRYFIGNSVPFELICLVVLTIAFGIVLHGTVIGRRIFAIGNNPDAARYSGIAVKRYKIAMFALTGIVSGLAAVFLTSRLGSVRSNFAEGWELQVITIVVLGGVGIAGGTGTVLGVALSALVIGALMFGLALINMPGLVTDLCLGVLLIATISIPHLMQLIFNRTSKQPQ